VAELEAAWLTMPEAAVMARELPNKAMKLTLSALNARS
jgi:hypothetical protein